MPVTPVRAAVVLVIDGLGAGWLGPYGNTWLETPHVNRLAAQSLLWETALAESPELALACRSYWTARHALEPAGRDEPALLHPWAAAGLPTVLLSDEPQVIEHPLAAHFSQRRFVEPLAASQPAATIEETGLFRLVAEACDQLSELSEPALLWIHAQGPAGPWDAPLTLCEPFVDEEDPAPPLLVVPPERELAPGYDPDELLGIVQCYAGQVALADECLGVLLAAIEEHARFREGVFALTAPRGYPLGEHLRVGLCDRALYSELLHVPLLIRWPGCEPARVPSLVQPSGLPGRLDAACGGTADDAAAFAEQIDQAAIRPACATSGDERALRTPAWHLRVARAEGEPRYELFAKPDDRWEANEVAARCPDEVALLAAELAQFEAAAATGGLAELPPLTEALCDVWR